MDREPAKHQQGESAPEWTAPSSTNPAGSPATSSLPLFAVSPGHTLIVPRRPVLTVFDCTTDEIAAMWRLMEHCKRAIEAEFRPDGYNIGINCGADAGQTIFHAHVHLIPRYRGDHPNPRGGVRHIIPGKGDYPAG